jgi:RNA polymerase sigma factor (sigma-70 family)
MRIISRNTMQITPEILEACEKNDRRAQKQLYELCFRMHMGVCYSYYGNEEDARSALNNAFLKICQNLSTIDSNVKVFYSWSRKILVNSIIDDFRKQKRLREHIDFRENDCELEFVQHSNGNDGEEGMREDDIKLLINQLPEATRIVFTMFVVDGYSHKEIAEVLGFTEGTSKWHLSVARKQLRDWIEELEEAELKIKLVI